jgi:iron complex transport system substrate-binding protein
MFPITIDAANGRVTLDARPERIVSLSPTATEMLFAIAAGDQVEAVDDQSDYPSEAPTTDLSGFEPNVEAVAGYEPDLVIASNDSGQLQESLDALEIPFLLQPAAATLDDSYAQIEELGEVTGHADEARAVTAAMAAEVDDLLATVPEPTEPLTYYHELDETYFSVTSETFIGQIYALVGLENIADEAKGAGSGYPQLSAEYILDADPDLIFLADTKCCDQSAATVAERPGWDRLSAVENDAVVGLDDDIASRWGPRVVDLLRVVATAVADRVM